MSRALRTAIFDSPSSNKSSCLGKYTHKLGSAYLRNAKIGSCQSQVQEDTADRATRAFQRSAVFSLATFNPDSDTCGTGDALTAPQSVVTASAR